VEEVTEIADRCVVLYRGAIEDELDRQALTKERLIRAAVGAASTRDPHLTGGAEEGLSSRRQATTVNPRAN
jgi:ABC-type sugar transport system ATPase subunit